MLQCRTGRASAPSGGALGAGGSSSSSFGGGAGGGAAAAAPGGFSSPFSPVAPTRGALLATYSHHSASPRHPARLAAQRRALLARSFELGLVALLVLGVCGGVAWRLSASLPKPGSGSSSSSSSGYHSYYDSSSSGGGVGLDPDCPECTHGRSAKAAAFTSSSGGSGSGAGQHHDMHDHHHHHHPHHDPFWFEDFGHDHHYDEEDGDDAHHSYWHMGDGAHHHQQHQHQQHHVNDNWGDDPLGNTGTLAEADRLQQQLESGSSSSSGSGSGSNLQARASSVGHALPRLGHPPAPVVGRQLQEQPQQPQQQQPQPPSPPPPPSLHGGDGHDPLHDGHRHGDAAAAAAVKGSEQLAALSRVVQQQQDTIKRQASALTDLQRRFVQQERQLSAANAGAAAADDAAGTTVEPYFPEEKVAQELDLLHRVEAQIDEVSASVASASAALPAATPEQRAAREAELARADALMSRLSRVAAAISLRTADPLTQGGRDAVAELRHYYGTAATNVTLSWQEALARQARPRASWEADPFMDTQQELGTLDARVGYAGAMLRWMDERAPCKVALVTTWSGDRWGLRRELLPWLTYHAQLGVGRAYVLYEGGSDEALRALRSLAPHVTVLLASAPLASPAEAAAFDAWVEGVPDAHIRDWRSQPGNYQLMTKQGYAVTRALELARADGVAWLIHADPDELLHPGASHTAGDLGASFSLLPELCSAPANVPSIRFTNVEGVPEAAGVANRYEQVTLFRAHRHLVQPAVQPFRYIFKQGHAEAWLHLYTNGKAAVRPDAPGVAQGGPHVFLGPAHPRWASPDNPHGLWRPAISNSTLVLHYAYASPRDVAVKAGRACPAPAVAAALAGNASAAAECFVLPLDQRAFLAAARDRVAAGLAPVADRAAHPSYAHGHAHDPTHLDGTAATGAFDDNASWPVGKEVLDFYYGELVLSEGAPFECLTPDGRTTGWCAMRNVDHLKSLLISSGLMMRLHAPAMTMRGIETAIQQIAHAQQQQQQQQQGGSAAAGGGAAAAGGAGAVPAPTPVPPTAMPQQQQQQGAAAAAAGGDAAAALQAAAAAGAASPSGRVAAAAAVPAAPAAVVLGEHPPSQQPQQQLQQQGAADESSSSSSSSAPHAPAPAPVAAGAAVPAPAPQAAASQQHHQERRRAATVAAARGVRQPGAADKQQQLHHSDLRDKLLL